MVARATRALEGSVTVPVRREVKVWGRAGRVRASATRRGRIL
jgi:hypothetical protein